MYNVKLPENMEWRKPKEPTPCVEPGWYAWRFGSRSGLTYCQQGNMLGEGYELAGPIEFDIPTPLPEPLQLDGCCKPELWKDREWWLCMTKDNQHYRIIDVVHKDKRVAILAHNAAVRVMMEHTK